MTDIAEQGHCATVQKPIKNGGHCDTHSITVPMKPSLKPVRGPRVPSQRVIYLPHILLKPGLYFGFWAPAGDSAKLFPHPSASQCLSNQQCFLWGSCLVPMGRGLPPQTPMITRGCAPAQLVPEPPLSWQAQPTHHLSCPSSSALGKPVGMPWLSSLSQAASAQMLWHQIHLT